MAQASLERVASPSRGATVPASTAPARTAPFTLALMPWGDLIEDFLDEIGLSLDEFASNMTGGWLFGYVAALQRYGVRTIIFCVSGRVSSTLRTVHEPTGAALVILPASAAYRALRRSMKNPYGTSDGAMFGATSRFSRPLWRAAHGLGPSLATPIGALAREIRRARCSAILCQEYESPRFDVSVLMGRLLRLPVFATFQGGTWSRSGLERRARPHALRRSAGLIIGS